MGIIRLSGVKDIPDAEYVKTIAKFILDQFPDFSYSEVAKSFVMAMGGKLGVDAEDYNSFDIPYVGRILKAYQKYRQAEIQKANRRADVERQEVKDTPERRHDHFLWVQKYIRENKELPSNADWFMLFKHLVKDQKVSIDENQTKEWEAKVKNIMAAEARDLKIKIKLNPDTLRYRCRVEYVKDYLTKRFLP